MNKIYLFLSVCNLLSEINIIVHDNIIHNNKLNNNDL